ncbi:MAG: glycosyltransferase family 4 protein [Candidatus Binatia bacterium]
MRIALVVAGPYPAFRGSQVLVGHVADGLRSRGHMVRIVTYGTWLAERPGPHPGRIVLDAVLLARLVRIVWRDGIDVIHAHNYEGAIAGLAAARVTGRPLVYHGHSAMADELPTYVRSASMRRVAGWLGRALDAHVPRRADFCIAVTDELGARLRQVGVREDALTCIEPVAVPGDLRAMPPSADDEPLVCYAGNLDGYQNLEFLLAAFARVRAVEPRARLVLVTHADAQAGAARLAAGATPSGVEIVHAASYDEVRARLGHAAVAVCPRTERSGFPMKLLNYMAEGKAIVASAGSAKGLADGVTGVVVPDGDADAFARAVVGLLRDPLTRARLGRAARASVEDARVWENVLERLEGVYHRVASRAGVRPAHAPVTGVRP